MFSPTLFGRSTYPVPANSPVSVVQSCNFSTCMCRRGWLVANDVIRRRLTWAYLAAMTHRWSRYYLTCPAASFSRSFVYITCLIVTGKSPVRDCSCYLLVSYSVRIHCLLSNGSRMLQLGVFLASVNRQLLLYNNSISYLWNFGSSSKLLRLCTTFSTTAPPSTLNRNRKQLLSF